MITVLLAMLAITGTAIVVMVVTVTVASHRERLRRLRAPQQRARCTEARLQANTQRTMAQMMDVARQASQQRHH